MSVQDSFRARLIVLLLAIALPLTTAACDGLLAANALSTCSKGSDCSPALSGIPALPPPPCWNEAGEIQSDEVCARVHEEEGQHGEMEDGGMVDGEGGALPRPPELP
ncbi:MAG TPA: hypothetical protein VF190_01500 [Rhodothermales bacterium]